MDRWITTTWIVHQIWIGKCSRGILWWIDDGWICCSFFPTLMAKFCSHLRLTLKKEQVKSLYLNTHIRQQWQFVVIIILTILLSHWLILWIAPKIKLYSKYCCFQHLNPCDAIWETCHIVKIRHLKVLVSFKSSLLSWTFNCFSKILTSKLSDY